MLNTIQINYLESLRFRGVDEGLRINVFNKMFAIQCKKIEK